MPRSDPHFKIWRSKRGLLKKLRHKAGLSSFFLTPLCQRAIKVTDTRWIEDMAAQIHPNKMTAEAPQTVGMMLSQARQQLGLSLSDVATVTRIPRTMLEHLEQDLFDEYCAEVFARGHLLNYAREMRLDQEKVMSAYARQTGKARAAQTSAETAEPSVATLIKPKADRARKPRAAAAAMSAKSKQAARRPAQGSHKLLNFAEQVRPRHMAGLVLILCALFAAVTLINGNRATAQNPANFPEPSKDDWSLERDVEKTRWLLEQPASLPPSKQEATAQP